MHYDKTILVTGGAGFIGSNFLNMMVPRYPNYRFINLDALTYAANLDHVTVKSAPNYHFVHGDIRDSKSMTALFEIEKPTHVIHFAAESHVDNSIIGPTVFVETNVMGTLNLLEAARAHNVVRFHHISTDEVYGSLSLTDPKSTENAQIAPNSPYSASKASSDLLVRAYHHTYGMDTVITRASNNYGPHQHTEKLIPRFITNLLAGKHVPVYGTGENVRDWIHVSDHVEGIDAVFHHGNAGEVYNLGGNNEIKNIDITKRLIGLAGKGEGMIEYVADRLGHDLRYALDTTKATRELGWAPQYDFETGLTETFEYYRSLQNI
jgi:dTDP-glucose 4,6-dehydratase